VCVIEEFYTYTYKLMKNIAQKYAIAIASISSKDTTKTLINLTEVKDKYCI